MRTHNISSAIESLLDDFFLLQKDVSVVSGLYYTVIREAEYAVIKKAMLLAERNKNRASKILGISRNTLNSKLKSLKIEMF